MGGSVSRVKAHVDFHDLYSLWDRRADALTALRKALEKEPAKVRSWLAADPMFDGLKGAPEFEQLVSAK